MSVTCFAVVSATVKAVYPIPFEQVVFARGLICLIISISYLRFLGISPWGENRKLLILRACAGTVALACFFYTVHSMPLATAVTIQYLNPVFTVLLSGLFFGEKVRLWHWLCTILGFAGVFVIQGFDTRVEGADVMIGLLGAFSAAVAYNTVRSLRDSDHEQVVIFYFPFVATILSAPFAVWAWVWPSPMQWVMLGVVGILTQLAQLFLTRGYQAEAASSVSVVQYVGVLYAIGSGVIFFNEKLPWTTVAGILMILVSVIASRWPLARPNLR